MKDLYKQCKLVKKLSDGVYYTDTCWIPDKFANKNDILRIKYKDQKWDSGWVVVEVYNDTLCTLGEIPDPYIMRKTHRKRTGDSLPK